MMRSEGRRFDGRGAQVPDAARESAEVLSDINFTNLDWEKAREKKGIHLSFEHKGQKFSVVAKVDDGDLSKQKKFSFCDFTVKDQLNRVLVETILTLKHSEDGVEVEASVTNNRNRTGNALPSGFGIEFYKKVLEFLPQIASEYNKSATHKVVALPREGLPVEKWRQIFEPVLTENQYQKRTDLGEDVWSKVYPFEEGS